MISTWSPTYHGSDRTLERGVRETIWARRVEPQRPVLHRKVTRPPPAAGSPMLHGGRARFIPFYGTEVDEKITLEANYPTNLILRNNKTIFSG